MRGAAVAEREGAPYDPTARSREPTTAWAEPALDRAAIVPAACEAAATLWMLPAMSASGARWCGSGVVPWGRGDGSSAEEM